MKYLLCLIPNVVAVILIILAIITPIIHLFRIHNLWHKAKMARTEQEVRDQF